MSKLISRKEAKLAWANGENVQILCAFDQFCTITNNLELGIFDNVNNKFRLKPRTITLNNIEIPAPFEPKEGEDCRCYYISTTFKHGFDWYHSTHHESNKIAWRTEEEIKQVVSALRSVFKGGVI